MNALVRCFHLPLLAKELSVRAARWQTYVVRVVYALLFFGAFLWMARGYVGVIGLEGLGEGGKIISSLSELQLLGICLLVPAQMCGAVARERETGSLPLLMLTPLGPWRIILQKYFAGLVPMLTCLLLSAPLFAIAYAFGGFEPWLMVMFAIMLVLALCGVGAFALLCSTCCRTSAGAFVATYVVGALLVFATSWLVDWTRSWLVAGIRAGLSLLTIRPSADYRLEWWIALWCLPGAVLTLASLILARIELQRRAFRPPRPRKPRRTWAVARGLRTLNAQLGGVIFGRSSALPEDQPIAWREGRRFGLHHGVGAFRLGAWITALAYALVVVLEFASLFVRPYEDVDWVSPVAALLVGAAALAMVPYAASAFTAERAGETLAVLLTTPLTARQIVAQKAQFLTRIQLAFIPAIFMLFAAQAGLYAWHRRGAYVDDPALVWLGSAIPALMIYPQVLVWVGLWIGLICRTTRLALLVTLIGIATFLLLPEWLVGNLYSPNHSGMGDALVHIVGILQFETTRFGHHLYAELGRPWMAATAAHYVFYAAIALGFRHLCLTRADRQLRRHA